MSDFDPPFADSADWRLPNTNETLNGFPCGPADQRLFNGMFRLLFGQVRDIAQEAGVSSNDVGDTTVLKRAVLALIDQYLGELGEGEEQDFSNFVLLSQAQNRLPIFLEIENQSGRIVPAVPDTGSIQVPSGISFLHRGIRRYNTSDWDSPSRTFETSLSTVYHLRWTRDGGFALRSLADGAYNPETLTESDEAFDSSYDDALIARVVTNSSNVATITGLENRALLEKSDTTTINHGNEQFNGLLTAWPYEDNTRPEDIQNYVTETLDWARRPRVAMTAINDPTNSTPQDAGNVESNVGVRPLSRYAIAAWWQRLTRPHGTHIRWEAWR